MQLSGKNFIGSEPCGGGEKTFQGYDPVAGQALEPTFREATPAEVNAALEKAEHAFPAYRALPPEERAAFLRRIAVEIERLGEPLIERAAAETALPTGRLTGERARTVNQLRLFADLVEEGSWVDARIDTAQPERRPAPKPDLRRMLIPLGPVAVFGASNFPLAFSVAGGDTASALAAGCPVIFKAHPAHPGTAELVARAVLQAAEATGMPEGVFSLVHGAGHEVGLQLVRHPLTRAVGFTGSLKAGRALFDAAAARSEPIPVYAEMGSINPVFVLPAALEAGAEALAEGVQQSITLGVGQFCTNPGLVVGLADERLERFTRRLADLLDRAPAGTMLYPGIQQGYEQGIASFCRARGIEVAAGGSAPPNGEPRQARAALFVTDAQTFLETPHLHEEVFGPSSLVVRGRDVAELEEIARSLEGQLTATLHATEEDLVRYASLVALLERKVGRLIFNGYPTGVEVCPSMHHGGPYPATTDVRSTSVGTAAIYRFARPICYQGFPEAALPPELRNRNERGIWRLLDGRLSQDDVPGGGA